MTSLFKGEVGKTIQVLFYNKSTGAALDISTATVKELRIEKPNGTRVEWAMSFVTDGTDGLARYITASSSDLDLVGQWFVQGHVTSVTFDWYTDKTMVVVGDVIAEP